jgi:hypothetical protein
MASGILVDSRVIDRIEYLGREIFAAASGPAVERNAAEFRLFLIPERLRGVVRIPLSAARALDSRDFPIPVMARPACRFFSVVHKNTGGCPLAAESVQLGIQRFVGESHPCKLFAKDADAVANVDFAFQFDVSAAGAYGFKGIAS